MSHIYFSWLLHDPNMELRSMYTPYILAVDRYLKKMAEILAPLQVNIVLLHIVLTICLLIG